MKISLEYYKIFYYTAKNKNVTKASKELNISQPSISRMLKSLEEQLGTTLFIREKRGVILTNEGKELYEQIHSSIENIINSETNFKRLIDTKSIKICVDSNLLNNYLIRKIPNDSLQKNISFLNTYNFSTLNKQLVNNLVDCAIITNNTNFKFDDSLIYKEIDNMRICLVSKKKVDNSNLYDNNIFILQNKESGFGKYICETLETNNINIQNSITVDNYENILPLVYNNFGIAFVIEEFVRDQLHNKELFKIDSNINFNDIKIGILYNKNNENNIKNIINQLI